MHKSGRRYLLNLVFYLPFLINYSLGHKDGDINIPDPGKAFCSTGKQIFQSSDIDSSTAFKNAIEDCNLKRANRVLQYCDIASNPLLTKDLEDVTWKEEDTLRVFLVPHSHNDAVTFLDQGWVYTFEMYYSVHTKKILDRMLDNLIEDPQLRFVWAEIAFFDLWWKDLDEESQTVVRRLAESKQLEFVDGGWVMPDEASVHFLPFLTQMIEGHQWLQQHLNYTPKNGWQIDPFGLSQSFAHLRKLSGMDNTVVLRMDYHLKNYLAEQRNLEFKWIEQPWNTHDDGLLTHVLPFAYDTSHSCGPESKSCKILTEGMTGERQFNVTIDDTMDEEALNLLKQLRKQSMYYQTKNLFIPIGGDFMWNSEYEWNDGLSYLKSIMDLINSQDDYNTELQISTLDEYFTAVKLDMRDLNITMESLTGDLFPYADLGEDYWSGYFSSRMYHKVTERKLMAEVRSAQILFSFMVAQVYKMGQSLDDDLLTDLLAKVMDSRRSLHLFQHHDAIAGTSTDDVVRHSSRRLHKAMEDSQQVSQLCLHFLTRLHSFENGGLTLAAISANDTFLEPLAFRRAHDDLWRNKILQIDAENPQVVISVFNPLAHARAELIRLNVSDPNVLVYTVGGHEKEMPSEILPIFEFNNQSKTLISCDDKFELTFLANFGPLNTLSFKIVYAIRPESQVKLKMFNSPGFEPTAKFRAAFNFSSDKTFVNSSNNIKISNAIFSLSFNSTSGTLNQILMNGKKIPVDLTFQYYSTYSSGLYLFRPNRPVTTLITDSSPIIIAIEGGFQSYLQVYYDTVINRVSLFSHFGLESNAIHIENLIDISKKENYEMIMQVNTNINSSDIFYTDSNGFQIMKRQRLPDLPPQGNYYPMATSAFIEDDSLRMTLLAAQPGGLTSLKSGQLEVMLDRIISQDDSRGVGQGGKDNLPVVTKFKILFEKPKCEGNSDTMPMLSLTAHHHLNQLLFPLNSYVHNQGSSSGILDYTLKHTKPSPCDMFLLANIFLPQPDPEGRTFSLEKSIGILIQRLGYDHRFDDGSLALTCDREKDSSGEFNIRKIFGEMFQDLVTKMSLTFTKEQGILNGTENHPMEPMSLVSILANYQSNDKI